MDARTQLLIDIANQLKPNAVDPQTLLYAAAAADKLISFGVTSLTDLATVIQFDQNEYGEPQRKEIIINKKNQAQIPNQLLHDGYGTFIEIMPSGQLTQKFDLQTKLARQITERVNFKEAKGTAWEAYGEKNGLPGLSYDIAKHLLAKNPNITDISQIKPEDMPSGRLYNATGGEGETVIELKYNDKGPSFETWGRSNGLSGAWEGLGKGLAGKLAGERAAKQAARKEPTLPPQMKDMGPADVVKKEPRRLTFDKGSAAAPKLGQAKGPFPGDRRQLGEESPSSAVVPKSPDRVEKYMGPVQEVRKELPKAKKQDVKSKEKKTPEKRKKKEDDDIGRFEGEGGRAFRRGGAVKSASSRGDGIASRGKTKGRYI